MKTQLTSTHGILVLVFVFLLLILIVVKKYDLLCSFSVQEFNFPKEYLVYIPYKGKYSKMEPTVKKTEAKFLKEGLTNKEDGPNKICRIYYDDPKQVKEGRALIGCLVTNSKKANEFIKNSTEFKIFEFKGLKGLGVAFPFYNFLNYLSAVYRGYPKLKEQLKKNEITREETRWVLIEIFDYKNKNLKMAVPYLNKNDSIMEIAADAQVLSDETSLMLKPKKIALRSSSSKSSLKKN